MGGVGFLNKKLKIGISLLCNQNKIPNIVSKKIIASNRNKLKNQSQFITIIIEL